jgi:hypothetical protein
MMKINIDKARIHVTARFTAEGSVLRETIRSGSPGLEMRSEIFSGEPADKVAALIRNAENGCYIMQTILKPTPVSRQFTFNGTPFDPDSFKKQ